MKEESEKGGSTLNIQKTKIMATGPITSRQIKRDRFYSGGGSKITVDDDCYHEIKRCLLLGRKAVTNLDGVLKTRDITLPANIHIVRGIVFSIVIYGYESWTIKMAEQ